MSSSWIVRLLAAVALFMFVMGRIESSALFSIAAGVWFVAHQRSAP